MLISLSSADPAIPNPAECIRIEKSPIKELIITNTIPLPEEKKIEKIKVVSIAPLFAETIKRLNEKAPLGELLKKFI